MKIHFCKSNGVGAWLIRFLTFSNWNHVAIEINGLVWDSTGIHGVKVWSPETFFNHYEKVETRSIFNKNEYSAQDFLRKQLGKEYDFTALLALPFREDWQDKNKWFCSELVTEALVRSGYDFSHLPTYRVTPRDLWILLGGRSD